MSTPFFFFLNDPATTETSTLPLPAPLPTSVRARAPHRPSMGPLLPREVANDPAGERVAGAGRVVDGLERVGRHEEERAVGHQEGAVLAALDDDGSRADRGDRQIGRAHV